MIITHQDVLAAESELKKWKVALAKERGWRMSGEMHDMWIKDLPACKMHLHLDAVIEVERYRETTAPRAFSQEEFASDLLKDEIESSIRTKQIATGILAQPAMQERMERATSVEHNPEQLPWGDLLTLARLLTNRLRVLRIFHRGEEFEVGAVSAGGDRLAIATKDRATGVDHVSQQPPTNPPDGEHPRSDVWRLANLAHRYRDKIAVMCPDGRCVGVAEVIHDVNSPGIIIHARIMRQSDGSAVSDRVDRRDVEPMDGLQQGQ